MRPLPVHPAPATASPGPGKGYLDWKPEDPVGRGVEAVRPIRNQIRAPVEALLVESSRRTGLP
ncbi:hypothetical protein [Streptomyces sp. NPDC059460]|uniref:hypothetical protein n=1 Tax=Streptomyces sp. NPDC059460 TaxID=3346840 RepID=UPI0036C611AE